MLKYIYFWESSKFISIPYTYSPYAMYGVAYSDGVYIKSPRNQWEDVGLSKVQDK